MNLAAAPVAPLRVLFLVRSLTTGGAEKQLIAAAAGLRRRGHDARIAVFYREHGPFERLALEQGIELVDLRKGGRYDVLPFFARLRRALRELRVDALYSFLPSANVVASAATLGMARRPAIVWGIRSTNAGGARYDWLGRAAARAERWLASEADAIVVNSASGLRYHAEHGLPASRMTLVRNGLDLDGFRFDAAGRSAWRGRLGIADGTPLLLLAGRHDPVKGIEVFLEAIGPLDCRALVAGTWVPGYTGQLRALADRLGLADKVVWLDRQEDMLGLMSAADIVCSASTRSEGTSNVLIEALATNAVAVATDVGDALDIIGDPARIARPADVADLARALQAAMASLPSHDRAGPIPATLQRYSHEQMTAATEAVLADVVSARRRGDR